MAVFVMSLNSCNKSRNRALIFGGIKDSTILCTVYNFLKRFCTALCRRIVHEISMPNLEEAKEIAKRIEEKYHFPQVFGIIDGSHIGVTAPAYGQKDYTNRKGWNSLILQAVVDNKFCFRNINVTTPGSCHDATVFRNSNLYKLRHLLPQETRTIEGVDVPLMILGDPAYPLLPWLLKPYTGYNLSPVQESFNCYRSSVRIMVENSFGKLKARWRILSKHIDANIKFAPKIIGTCCILHNYCEKSNAWTNITTTLVTCST